LLLLGSGFSSSHLLSRNVKFKIYKTIILPAVLYGCETWSLTLRKEHIIKAAVSEVGCEHVDWIIAAQKKVKSQAAVNILMTYNA
jgi:hypothetical protein